MSPVASDADPTAGPEAFQAWGFSFFHGIKNKSRGGWVGSPPTPRSGNQQAAEVVGRGLLGPLPACSPSLMPAGPGARSLHAGREARGPRGESTHTEKAWEGSGPGRMSFPPRGLQPIRVFPRWPRGATRPAGTLHPKEGPPATREDWLGHESPNARPKCPSFDP